MAGTYTLSIDYGDIIYDLVYNLSFYQKLESIQYNAALALTGAIKGKSREKLYQELGLELFNCDDGIGSCFYKIYNKQAPDYLTELITTRNEAYQTRYVANVPSLSFEHIVFKNTFFPSAIRPYKTYFIRTFLWQNFPMS